MVPRPHVSAVEHNTIYVQICARPVGEDLRDFILQSPILPEDFVNRVGYHVTQQPEKYLCIYRMICLATVASKKHC